MVNWAQCRDYFEVDGALRDIYTIGGGIEGWRALVKVLANASPTFHVDGEIRRAPLSLEEAFSLRENCNVLMRATWKGILLCSHFFTPDEVELDLDPREVDSAERFSALTDFMTLLAMESRRAVILTDEGRY